MRTAPLFIFECVRLTWLDGWLADVERCSYIILLSCKIMSSFSWASHLSCWNLPGSQIILWSCSSAPSPCCCVASFFLLSLSSLAVLADRIISLLISLITASSGSNGWSCFCSLPSCKNFLQLGRSSWSPMFSSSVSNFTYWMCIPSTFTLSSRAFIYSHRLTKQIFSASSSSSASASRLKTLRHSSECSSSSSSA